LKNSLNQTSVAHESHLATPGPGVERLTRAMVAGDEAAYRQFHETYCSRLHRYLLVAAAGDEELAREALQAACIRVVRHIKVFPDEQIFWNWLTVLARTAFADLGRKRSRYRAFLERFTLHAQSNVADGAADDEANAQLLTALEGGVRELPPDERELLERKYFGREGVREIAEALQVSEKAVESRLARVRRKLKEALLNRLKNEATD
jgi:RNA polymerase sigma-70 factor, ECF subfamily